MLALLLVTPAYADYIAVTGKIDLIQNWEGHSGTLIRMVDRSKTIGVCERNDWYILPNSHKYADKNYSILLAAKMASADVTLHVQDAASAVCVEMFPRIYHVTLN